VGAEICAVGSGVEAVTRLDGFASGPGETAVGRQPEIMIDRKAEITRIAVMGFCMILDFLTMGVR
jgi:hypothetical protein